MGSVKLKLYNKNIKGLEEVQTQNTPVLKIYLCGPTVYNFLHIGNLRTYIFEDLLINTAKMLGYQTQVCMNITDVGHLSSDADEGEDKMIQAARQQGANVWDIAELFTQAFQEDFHQLNILQNIPYQKATENISSMIGFIQKLQDKGYVYQSQGNLYFDTAKLSDYGRLSLIQDQKSRSNHRVYMDPHKKNAADFVVWFTQSKYPHQAMMWDSPWGKGYPGWHTECAAIAYEQLGSPLDIHAGGVDHINVHHTNELAMVEALTGQQWVRHWLHCEFLLFDQEKMSKSTGHFICLKDLIERGFTGFDFMYFVLSSHYRKQATFSWQALQAAHNGIGKLHHHLGQAEILEPSQWNSDHHDYYGEFQKALSQDLNSALAISIIFKAFKDKKLDHRLSWVQTLLTMLHLETPRDAFPLFSSQKEGSSPLSKDSQPVSIHQLPENLQELFLERIQAKKNKDYERADQIRTIFMQQGYYLKDKGQQSICEKI